MGSLMETKSTQTSLEAILTEAEAAAMHRRIQHKSIVHMELLTDKMGQYIADNPGMTEKQIRELLELHYKMSGLATKQAVQERGTGFQLIIMAPDGVTANSITLGAGNTIEHEQAPHNLSDDIDAFIGEIPAFLTNSAGNLSELALANE